MGTSAPERIRLEIEGMTCASCVTRVEKALNGLEGVDARVNLATEEAAVAFDPARLGVDQLIRAVESIGYHAASPAARVRPVGDADRPVRKRLLLAGALTVPLTLLAMVPTLQFSGWEWLAFAIATPVVLWAGWPFHRAAVLSLRHRTTTMNTLISLGTMAAWGWSTVVVLARIDADLYFEVAAVITTLILLGRYLEARARRRSGAAIRALLELGVKEARVLRAGQEVLVPIEALRPGDRFVVGPGEKIATDGVVEEGSSAIDQSMLTGESAPVEVAPAPRSRGRRSIRTEDSSSAPPESAPRRRSRRLPGSSRKLRRERRRSSVSPTGSRASSSRSSSRSHSRRSLAGWS